VSVKDTGIGISNDLLPHIFNMFVQGEEPRQRTHGGLGLGLTLARELVQMHGGSIEAKSEGPGKGSAFIVRLPLAKAPGPVERYAPPSPMPAKSGARQVKRVLIVDDNSVHTQSLSYVLEMAGFEVRIARDAPSALETLQGSSCDVALIDIGLPGLSGYDLARSINEKPQFGHIVLVAQTGWGREEDRQSAREAGFEYHLTKPVEPEEIIKLLKGLAVD
jgi:CheY-like chemotaxis protein